jgi:hypothetical protein
MFSDGSQKENQRPGYISSPSLVGLAQELPEVLQHARAPNTNKCYGLAYARWKKWAEIYPEVSILPANPLHITLYLVFIAKSAVIQRD